MGLVALQGANFSGRTDWLRHQARSSNTPAPYVGAEVHNYISALSADVAGELRLHARGQGPSDATRLIEVLRLRHLLDRNPFTLSGGQQAVVAVLSAAAMGSASHFLDTCLEQLDLAHRDAFLAWASKQASDWFVADNRLDEVSSDIAWAQVQRLKVTPSGKNGPLDALALDTFSASGSGSVSLQIEDLSFGYGRDARVFDGLSLDLNPGLYLLEGANGAGKSTLAKLLSGVLRPSRGRVLADGQEVFCWRSPGRLVGYHFQNPDLQLFSPTVREELHNSLDSQSEETLLQIAFAFGLHRALGIHPLDLPFVGRKRIALAATFAMDAPWLILDEPTLGQDTEAMESIAKGVTALASAGRGVIVISHSTRFLERLGGARLLLEAGHVTCRNDR